MRAEVNVAAFAMPAFKARPLRATATAVNLANLTRKLMNFGTPKASAARKIRFTINFLHNIFNEF
jgi:hypothetical protein